ncbi:hypothetical protein Dimus_004606 [Dionaea muscipula]
MKREKVSISTRRSILVLLLILAGMSILRLLRVAITTYSSTPLSTPILTVVCNSKSKSSTCRSNSNEHGFQVTSTKKASTNYSPNITGQEFKFLANLITKKAPCNLLIFGLEHEYVLLSEINAAGTTIILEDDPDKLKKVRRRASSNSTRIQQVKYENPARDAYKLLEHARKDQVCAPNYKSLESSACCRLALTRLPKHIYRHKWDVVLVDGPRSDGPEAPGRMDTIYTASLIARSAGGITNVLVHDVDRTIEKWFAWEFLCEHNLVSSKGRFWNFRIVAGGGGGGGGGPSKSSSFCSQPTHHTNHHPSHHDTETDLIREEEVADNTQDARNDPPPGDRNAQVAGENPPPTTP